jgi:recombinational DNA repair protein RecR
MFITGQIAELNPKIKITRLARGLPAGAPLQLAPKGVLADAISGRTVI